MCFISQVNYKKEGASSLLHRSSMSVSLSFLLSLSSPRRFAQGILFYYSCVCFIILATSLPHHTSLSLLLSSLMAIGPSRCRSRFCSPLPRLLHKVIPIYYSRVCFVLFILLATSLPHHPPLFLLLSSLMAIGPSRCHSRFCIPRPGHVA